MQVVYKKNRDSRRVSGPPLLEVTCYQHLDGIRSIVLTDHALYAALPRINGDLVYNT